MNGPTLAAVALAAVAGYGAVIVILGRWVGRAAAEQTSPVSLSPEESERLWRDILATPPRTSTVPRQFHAVGEPLTSADLDRIIASFEPCGSTAPTCRLHDPELCRTGAPCCATCPETKTTSA